MLQLGHLSLDDSRTTTLYLIDESKMCGTPLHYASESKAHIYEGTAVKDSNKRQGSERHTRFQHFITCAIHNQFLIFK
jgi:hypothetical protein